MKDVPDSPLRLYLRLTLKAMAVVVVLGVIAVATGYLGGGADEGVGRDRYDVSELPAGRARTVGWGGRAVVVLHRSPETRDALGGALAGDPSPAWYVAYAAGTATGCTVVWQRRAERFRESCGRATWDAAGRPRSGTDADPLRSPPHRITADGRLILGAEGG